MLRISRLIDGAINRIGTAAAWAVFPLIAVVLIDVVSKGTHQDRRICLALAGEAKTHD